MMDVHDVSGRGAPERGATSFGVCHSGHDMDTSSGSEIFELALC